MDWQSVVAIGALLVAAFAAISRALDKSLTVREHEEFRQAIRDQFTMMNHQRERDFDRVEHRLDIIEATRPTAETLQARIEGTKGT